MAVKIEVNLTNKWLYSLIFLGTLLVLGVVVYAYGSGGPPSTFGHSGEEMDVTIDGVTKTLNQALDEIKASVSNLDYQTVNSNSLSLIPGKKYLVHVYGTTRNAGQEWQTLGAVTITECAVSPYLLLSATPTASINWPDGSAPQSASMIITAPTSGCINGYVDDYRVVNAASLTFRNALSMTAIQLVEN